MKAVNKILNVFGYKLEKHRISDIEMMQALHKRFRHKNKYHVNQSRS